VKYGSRLINLVSAVIPSTGALIAINWVPTKLPADRPLKYNTIESHGLGYNDGANLYCFLLNLGLRYLRGYFV